MMDNNFDIVVVGAGPAGAMAARYAAMGKRRVALVERKQQVGVPVRCGEGVGLKGVSLSVKVRPEWIKSTIKKIAVVAPDDTQVILRNVDESYILDREKMDSDLVDDSISAGAAYFNNTSIRSVSQSSDGMYTLASPTRVFKAPCIIIADGVESRLARDCGWSEGIAPKDIETCAYTHVFDDSISDDTCIFFTGANVAPGGFVWIFPRGKGCANVGLGILGSSSTPGKARQLLEKFIARRFPTGRTDQIHAGGVPVARWLNPLTRGGAMVVGDAARQVNCVNGGGIAYSLLAGTMAGKAAANAFDESGKFYCKKLACYQKEWSRFHGKQQLRSYSLKRVLVGFDDAFFNSLAASLSKENPDKLNYLKVFSKTFSKRPLLLFKVFRLFKP